MTARNHIKDQGTTAGPVAQIANAGIGKDGGAVGGHAIALVDMAEHVKLRLYPRLNLLQQIDTA